MKIIGWALTAALAAASAPAIAGDLTVTLTGVQDKGGQMLVSLQKRDQFMKPEGANGAYGAATPGTQSFTVRNVEPGEYVVMVMHDVDSNWKMARKAGGEPAEGWAMSGKFDVDRAPTFDQTKIAVSAAGGSVILPMVYP